MKKKTKVAVVGDVKSSIGDLIRGVHERCSHLEDTHITDVHAYKVNPNEPTAEDLDVGWPEVVDRRFQ